MTRSVLGLIACATLLIALGRSAALAQAAVAKQTAATPFRHAPVALDNETLGHFETAFAAISDTAQVTIAAEGVPFIQSLTPADAAALNRSVTGPDVDLDEEMALIALAYDYDVERTSRSCFLLRKRHSDPNDLPDVTYAEIVHSLQAVLGTIDSFVPTEPPPGARRSVFDFYDSLTAEQLAQARDGIVLSELDPSQRKIALSAAAQSDGKLQTDYLRSALIQLLALQDDRTVFTWITTSDALEFGYSGPFELNGAMRDVPLAESYSRQFASHRPADDPAGPTLPTKLDRKLAPGMLSNRLRSTLALGEFARSIAGDTESGLNLTVDPALSGKPICLFGGNFTTQASLIRDIAALYGLRVETVDHHNIAIDLPRRGAIRDPEDAPAEFARLIPPSLLRYESWKPWSAKKNTFALTEEPRTPREKRIAIAEATHNEPYIDSGVVTATSYYLPVVKRLRSLAEPAVPTKDSRPVPVKALGPETERLIALMALAGGGVGQLGKLREYIPPSCFFDLDRMVVQLKDFSNRAGNSMGRSVAASFGYRDENGKFVHELGSNEFVGVAK